MGSAERNDSEMPVKGLIWGKGAFLKIRNWIPKSRDRSLPISAGSASCKKTARGQDTGSVGK